MTFEELVVVDHAVYFAGVRASELAVSDVVQRSDGHVFAKLYIGVDNETGAIDVALETCTYRMHDASVYWERELRGPGAACDFVSRARAMLAALLGAPTSSGAMFAGALPWYTWTFLPPGGINFFSEATIDIYRTCLEACDQWNDIDPTTLIGPTALTHAQLLRFPCRLIARDLDAHHTSDAWLAACDAALTECEECDTLLREHLRREGIPRDTASHWLF